MNHEDKNKLLRSIGLAASLIKNGKHSGDYHAASNELLTAGSYMAFQSGVMAAKESADDAESEASRIIMPRGKK